MALYDVILKPSVEKDVRALPRTARARVLARLEQLREEPRPRQAVQLVSGEAWYRVRVVIALSMGWMPTLGRSQCITYDTGEKHIATCKAAITRRLGLTKACSGRVQWEVERSNYKFGFQGM